MALEKTQAPNSAIAPTQREGVVVRGTGIEVHSGAIMPPIVAVVQPTSEEGTPGMLRRSDTGEEFETLKVVPIISSVTQTLWPHGQFERGREPMCWSTNGRYADPGAEFEGRACMDCEFYTPRPYKGMSSDYMCRTGHNILIADADSFEILGLRLSGTANRIAYLITNPIRVMRVAVVELSTKKSVADQGTWYQLQAKLIATLAKEEAEIAKGLVQDYLQVNLGYEGQEEQAEPEGSTQETVAEAPAEQPPPEGQEEAPAPQRRRRREMPEEMKQDAADIFGNPPEGTVVVGDKDLPF